jgi:hypothetical protein
MGFDPDRVPDAAARSLADSLLSNADYHIEFQGYLTNHVKHAIVALAYLEAPRDRIQEYWDMYTAETPYGYTLEPAEAPAATPLTTANWAELMGKKENFPALVQFFAGERRELGLSGVLQAYAHTLLPGCAGMQSDEKKPSVIKMKRERRLSSNIHMTGNVREYTSIVAMNIYVGSVHCLLIA